MYKMDGVIRKNVEKLQLEVDAYREHLKSFNYTNEWLRARFEFQKIEKSKKLECLRYIRKSNLKMKQEELSNLIKKCFQIIKANANMLSQFQMLEFELFSICEEYNNAKNNIINSIECLESNISIFKIEITKLVLDLRRNIKERIKKGQKYDDEIKKLNSLVEYKRLKSEQEHLEEKSTLSYVEEKKLENINNSLGLIIDKIEEEELKLKLQEQEKKEKGIKNSIKSKIEELAYVLQEEKNSVTSFFKEKKKEPIFNNADRVKFDALKEHLIKNLDLWTTIPQNIINIEHTTRSLKELEILNEDYFVSQNLETLENYELKFVDVGNTALDQIVLPEITINDTTNKPKRQDIFMGVIVAKEELNQNGNCIQNNSIRDLIIKNTRENERRFFYVFDLGQWDKSKKPPQIVSHLISVVQEGTRIYVFDSLGNDKVSDEIFNKFILDERPITAQTRGQDERLSYLRNKQKLQYSSGLCEEYAVMIQDYNLRVQLFNNLVGEFNSIRDVLHVGGIIFNGKQSSVVSTELMIEIQEGLREDPFSFKQGGNPDTIQANRKKQAEEQINRLSGGGLKKDAIRRNEDSMFEPSSLKKPIGEQVIFSVKASEGNDKGVPEQTFNAMFTTDLITGLNKINGECGKNNEPIKEAGHVYENKRRREDAQKGAGQGQKV